MQLARQGEKKPGVREEQTVWKGKTCGRRKLFQPEGRRGGGGEGGVKAEGEVKTSSTSERGGRQELKKETKKWK